jgi:hypothetical protein
MITQTIKIKIKFQRSIDPIILSFFSSQTPSSLTLSSDGRLSFNSMELSF